MNKYAKAIVGAIIAGLGPLYLALSDGHVTGQEWITVATATLTALGVVWGVPNTDKAGVNLSVAQPTATSTFTVDD